MDEKKSEQISVNSYSKTIELVELLEQHIQGANDILGRTI